MIFILWGRPDHLPVSLKNDSLQQPDYLLQLPKSNQDDRNKALSAGTHRASCLLRPLSTKTIHS